MAEWNTKRDIRMTRDGDLMWGRGDFAQVTNEECAAQDGYIYLHTAIGDYGYWPLTGNRTAELIGEIVRENSAQDIHDRILACVTQHGRMPQEAVRVIVRKISDESYSVRVDIQTPEGFMTLLPDMVFDSSGVWRDD